MSITFSLWEPHENTNSMVKGKRQQKQHKGQQKQQNMTHNHQGPTDGLLCITRQCWDVSSSSTTNATVRFGVLHGDIPLNFDATNIQGFSELAKTWDQIRINTIEVSFHWSAQLDTTMQPYFGLFSYDPDGYTTASGSVLAKNNAQPFTISPYRSSRPFSVTPGVILAGTNSVKYQQWFDLAGTLPAFHVGGLMLSTTQPSSVTQLSCRVSWHITYQLRGAR